MLRMTFEPMPTEYPPGKEKRRRFWTSPLAEMTLPTLVSLGQNVFKASEIDAKRLIALFSIVVRNDRRTLRELVRPENARVLKNTGAGIVDKRYADPGLRFFAQLLRSNNLSAEPWFNSILLGIIPALAHITLSALSVLITHGECFRGTL